MREERYIAILKREIMPALGCTEPIAIAYASAKARTVLGKMPDMVSIKVSSNILKNAMGVGIPGTQMVGLEIAAALGIIGGDSDAILEVLHRITESDIQKAKEYVQEHVKVSLKDTDKKLYIEVEVYTAEDSAEVIIEDSHTNITRIQHGAFTIYEKKHCLDIGEKNTQKTSISIDGIYDFISHVDVKQLDFLKDTITMNWKIAREGISGEYGLGVGRSICESQKLDNRAEILSTREYASAFTAAAADARMAGCKLPVMTVCGSGNQGITATVPIIAVAKKGNYGEELLYKALALSCLVTVHVKEYIGKLSPLCGCGMGSSIGVCCALIYMQGGTLEQIKSGIKNMIADVSGIICDGAKSGCALKIATVVSSAFQCAVLALRNSSAGELDGIVSDNVETAIRNLGELGNKGMCNTDRVILNMMVCK